MKILLLLLLIVFIIGVVFFNWIKVVTLIAEERDEPYQDIDDEKP